jgi:hypothetical protein
MRLIVTTLLFIACFAVQASAQTITAKKQLRQQLIRAINSSNSTDSLYRVLVAQPVKTPVIVGYIAILQALKAKYSWNPYVKMQQISKAEKGFEKAIAADPQNLELRYLRYSVEHNLPAILSRSKNMAADKQEMLSQISKRQPSDEDRELVINIINYLLQNSEPAAAEKADLHKQLTALK